MAGRDKARIAEASLVIQDILGKAKMAPGSLGWLTGGYLTFLAQEPPHYCGCHAVMDALDDLEDAGLIIADRAELHCLADRYRLP